MCLDVVVQLDRSGFFRSQHCADFAERPGEVVAVVVEGIVGILAGIKTATLLVRENFVHPGDDAFGGFPQERIARNAPGVQVVSQQLGIVVGHFLEVRDEPALVDRIAMEAAGELIVNTAPSHFFECGFRYGEQMLFAGFLIAFEEQIDGGGVGELRRGAEAAVFNIESLR